MRAFAKKIKNTNTNRTKASEKKRSITIDIKKKNISKHESVKS